MSRRIAAAPLSRSLLLPALLASTVAAAGGEPPAGPLDGERVAEGRRIYQQQCASCHGARGEGMPDWEQPNALGELPAPPHDATGHTWKHADAMLYRMIRDGWRDPWNETERLTMPAFGDVLTPQEIGAVITYLKTLWTSEQRRFQREESRDAPLPPEAR